MNVGHTDDEAAPSHDLPRDPAADVAETLHDDAHAVERAAFAVQVALENVDRSPSGSRRAAGRAAEVNRLAGDDGGLESVAARVFVDHPGHRLWAGVEVGGGDVDVGADAGIERIGEDAGEPLELDEGELEGIDTDTALSPRRRARWPRRSSRS